MVGQLLATFLLYIGYELSLSLHANGNRKVSRLPVRRRERRTTMTNTQG
jgi:hypothetical protein